MRTSALLYMRACAMLQDTRNHELEGVRRAQFPGTERINNNNGGKIVYENTFSSVFRVHIHRV